MQILFFALTKGLLRYLVCKRVGGNAFVDAHGSLMRCRRISGLADVASNPPRECSTAFVDFLPSPPITTNDPPTPHSPPTAATTPQAMLPPPNRTRLALLCSNERRDAPLQGIWRKQPRGDPSRGRPTFVRRPPLRAAPNSPPSLSACLTASPYPGASQPLHHDSDARPEPTPLPTPSLNWIL